MDREQIEAMLKDLEARVLQMQGGIAVLREQLRRIDAQAEPEE